MHLTQVPFIVTDTETTGISPSSNRIIEIGAVKVVGGEVVDRYSQLINPERSVPHRISRLTGITTAMVFDQPTIGEVLPGYLKFLGDGVLVAHNLTFDKRFLNAELSRWNGSRLTNKSICTVRLARRLLGGLRSKGLSSVANFYGIRIRNRHRALGDAEATGQVLIRMLDRLQLYHSVENLTDLLAFQMRPYRKARGTPEHVLALRRKIAASAPATPGVYFMLDKRGKVVYIGKAKNLKQRTRSYFSAIEAHPPKTRDLIRVVRDIRWEQTATELAALLQESRLIKEQQPRFNRALRRHSRRPFIKINRGLAFPTVSFSSQLTDDGAEYFGPLRGTRHATYLLDIINKMYLLRECDDKTFRAGKLCMYGMIGRCSAPCVNTDIRSIYDSEVGKVRAFLTGADDTILDRLHTAMIEAADQLEFEEAREYRDWWQHLTALFERQKIVATPVLDHHATLAIPTSRTKEYEVYFIRYGRLDRSIRIRLRQKNWRLQIQQASIATFAPLVPRPSRYERGELDEVRILSNWLYHHRDSSVYVKWLGDDPRIHANNVSDTLARGASEEREVRV